MPNDNPTVDSNDQRHPAGQSDAQLRDECDVRFTRRRGPGGQHRNKVETAVVITHLPSGVIGQASERRSQRENLKQALFRLRLNLACRVRFLRPESASPSQLWRKRTGLPVDGGDEGRAKARISINPGHSEYPAVLAEALDWLWANELDTGRAAKRLGVSSSQLLKLIRLEPQAWQRLNDARIAQGLPRLNR